MIFYPVALKLAGRACLVIGSGEHADLRAENLRGAGADVRHVAAADFVESNLDGVWLAVQTDRDPKLAARVAAECEKRRIFFCATDDPGHASYAHMAIARAGLVQIAISTGGRAPALGRRLREELDNLLGASGLAELADRLAELRDRTPSEERSKVLADAARGVHFTGKLEVPGEPE